MKRLCTALLLISLLIPSALAQKTEVGQEFTPAPDVSMRLESVGILDTIEGVDSQTHKWAAADFALTNISLADFNAGGLMKGSLVYKGKHRFEGQAQMNPDVLELLVWATARLVFRVPLLVTEAQPGEAVIAVTVGNTEVTLGYPRNDTAPSAIAGQPMLFENPQDTVISFAGRIAEADFAGALNDFSADAQAQHHNLLKSIQRMRSYYPVVGMPLPSGDYPAYASLNAMVAIAIASRQTFAFTASLPTQGRLGIASPLPLDGDGRLTLTDGEALTPEALIARLDPEGLEGLALKGVYRYEADEAHSAGYRENIQRQAGILGSTEAMDLMAIYELDGRAYFHTCMVGRFEGGWQILTLNSPIQNTDSFGNAMPLSQEEAAEPARSADYIALYKPAE